MTWEVETSDKLMNTLGKIYLARIESETISGLWEEVDRFVDDWRAHRVSFAKEISFFSHVFSPEYANGKWHLELCCS